MRIQQVERRRRTTACVSCPACSGPVPVLARWCHDGDADAVLDCRTCGWLRPARREDPRH